MGRSGRVYSNYRSTMKLAWTVALMLVILSIQVDARSFQKVGTEESTRGLVQLKKVLMDQLSKIQTQIKISSEAGDTVQEKENRKCSLIQLISGVRTNHKGRTIFIITIKYIIISMVRCNHDVIKNKLQSGIIDSQKDCLM